MQARSQTLIPPAAPALPVPTQSYTRGTQDEHNRTLRGFFERVVNALRALLGPFGGQYVDCPNGLFFNLGTQTVAAANTGYPVRFEQTYLANGISVVEETKLTAEVGGVYNFQYSGCVESTNSSSKNVYLWITRNGARIGYTTNGYTLSGSGALGTIGWNFNIDLQAGDYVELYWSSTSTAVELTTEPPATPHTGIPASVCAVNFIAPLPQALPTPPTA
jgi:hypothetical protein